MSNGNNHAKDILISQLNSTVKKLEDGSSGNIDLIGKAVCDQSKIIAAIYVNNFRTVEDCDAIHEKLSKTKTYKTMKFKIGPVTFEKDLTPTFISMIPILICCGACAAMASKMLNWW